jgi:hypothetical protein
VVIRYPAVLNEQNAAASVRCRNRKEKKGNGTSRIERFDGRRWEAGDDHVVVIKSELWEALLQKSRVVQPRREKQLEG